MQYVRKTHILDYKGSLTTGRVYFELPEDLVYDPTSACFVDLGVTNATAGAQYPNNVGAGIVARRVTFEVGGSEIDQYDGFTHILALNSMKGGNVSGDLSRNTLRSAWSWTQEPVNGRDVNVPAGSLRYSGRHILNDPLTTGNANTTAVALTNVATTTPTGRVPVSNYLGSFSSLGLLEKLPKAIIRLDFDISAGNVNSTTTSTALPPSLIIDELVGAPASGDTYLYSQWLRENFPVAAAGAGIQVVTNSKSRANDGKFVQKMVIANQVADQAVGATRKILGSTGSRAMRGERLDVYVNKGDGMKALFPADGISSDAVKALYLQDSLGSFPLPRFGFNYDMYSRADGADNGAVIPQGYENLVGQTSFTAFDVNGRVSDQRFVFTRTGDATSTLADAAVLAAAYTVPAYSLVTKSLKVDRKQMTSVTAF
jgi:hypothetical protein